MTKSPSPPCCCIAFSIFKSTGCIFFRLFSCLIERGMSEYFSDTSIHTHFWVKYILSLPQFVFLFSCRVFFLCKLGNGKITQRMCPPFLWRNSNFRCRLGVTKKMPEMTNQLPAAEIHSSLGFQPGRVVEATEAVSRWIYSPWVSSEFLAILQSFCRLFSSRRVFDKRWWKRCVYWLSFAWPFSWWTRKRWDLLRCRVRPVSPSNLDY